jgi:hypothetical protein
MKMEKEIMLDIKAGKGLIDGILRSNIIKEDIHKLDLINVKTSLDQCKDVILNQQCELIEAYEAIVSGGCENGLIWKAEKYIKKHS